MDPERENSTRELGQGSHCETCSREMTLSCNVSAKMIFNFELSYSGDDLPVERI